MTNTSETDLSLNGTAASETEIEEPIPVVPDPRARRKTVPQQARQASESVRLPTRSG